MLEKWRSREEAAKEQRSDATLQSLQLELKGVRNAALDASRKGDVMRVARLTTQAARINRAILDLQNVKPIKSLF